MIELVINVLNVRRNKADVRLQIADVLTQISNRQIIPEPTDGIVDLVFRPSGTRVGVTTQQIFFCITGKRDSGTVGVMSPEECRFDLWVSTSAI